MTRQGERRKSAHGEAVVSSTAYGEKDVGSLAKSADSGSSRAQLTELFDESGAVPSRWGLAGQREDGVPSIEEAVEEAVQGCTSVLDHCLSGLRRMAEVFVGVARMVGHGLSSQFLSIHEHTTGLIRYVLLHCYHRGKAGENVGRRLCLRGEAATDSRRAMLLSIW